jgi:malonyl-CoA decarboxylase
MFGVGGGRTTVTARGGIKVAQLLRLCAKLLTERGQAVSTALARDALALYAELDRPQQVAFFKALLGMFSPDPREALQAAEQYAADPTAARLVELHRVAEPARQELLRRLNRVPGGTAAILRMRERLQQALREEPPLAAVDGDFRHLLASWFNPGFLQIVRGDWRTPAELLERINWGADASRRGLRDSFGMMVNYVYEPETIEKNHDRFLNGRIAASRQVTSLTLAG